MKNKWNIIASLVCAVLVIGILIIVYPSKPIPQSAHADRATDSDWAYIEANEPQTNEEWKEAIGETETLWSDPDGYIISIVYGDMKEDETLRKIKVMRVIENRNGNVYLDAFCFKRNDNRLFRLDRIFGFYDDTGERIEETDFLEILQMQE